MIKYGGNAMISETLKETVMHDVVLLQSIGVKVILVHGGGPEINDLMDRLNIEPRFVDGLRVTDRDTMDVVQMVLAGKLNKNIVSLIELKGGKAVGISGIDSRMLIAEQFDDTHGFVGRIIRTDMTLPLTLMDAGFIPVISSVATDEAGNAYNINADTAAAAVAGALKAEGLINLTEIPGLPRDKNDESTLITKVYVSDTPELIHEGVISGGMIPKVECCTQAIRMGVRKAFIIDGRIPHALLLETLTDEGLGTMFVG